MWPSCLFGCRGNILSANGIKNGFFIPSHDFGLEVFSSFPVLIRLDYRWHVAAVALYPIMLAYLPRTQTRPIHRRLIHYRWCSYHWPLMHGITLLHTGVIGTLGRFGLSLTDVP